MNRAIIHIILLSLFTTIGVNNVYAQKKKTARVTVEYFKDNLNKESLEAFLRVKDKSYSPQRNAEILFYCVNDTSRVLLDKITTGKDGKARFYDLDNPLIVKDTTGILNFEVDYLGNDSIKSHSKRIAVKQSEIEISFFQKDSIKSIYLNAMELGSTDEKRPIEGVEVKFYVRGTFSLLNFGVEETDENGAIQIAFPIDMPGDTAGILNIVAKIEENDHYGNVEVEGKINWAIPLQPLTVKQRGLGDTDAPLWMVYTLITLLSVVWIHYLYVIFLIIKIKLAR